MTTRRVIFPDPDIWTRPKDKSTMTTPSNDDDQTNGDILSYRAQLQAVEICRAVSDGDFAAAETMFTSEQRAGVLRELVSGMATIAVSLARTVAAHEDGITEPAIWAGLFTRAETGLLGSAEIAKLTDPEDKGGEVR